MLQKKRAPEEPSQLLRSAIGAVGKDPLPSRYPTEREGAVHDSVMCGFARMYVQDPSLDQFQKRMEDAKQTSNMKSLFHVDAIPGDTQLREVLDEVEASARETSGVLSGARKILCRGH
jgi:hypothetical protein